MITNDYLNPFDTITWNSICPWLDEKSTNKSAMRARKLNTEMTCIWSLSLFKSSFHRILSFYRSANRILIMSNIKYYNFNENCHFMYACINFIFFVKCSNFHTQHVNKRNYSKQWKCVNSFEICQSSFKKYFMYFAQEAFSFLKGVLFAEILKSLFQVKCSLN